MRYLVLLFVLFFPVQAQAQRVFRASIDEKQNKRLDKLESAVDRLTNIVEILATTPPPSPEKKPAPVVTVSRQTQPISNRYTRQELESIVRQHYPNGDYTRYADVSPRSGTIRHLMDSNHQFTSAQVSGMDINLALGLHGLHHRNLITSNRGSYKNPVQKSIQIAQPLVQPSQSIQMIGGCANGQCARQSVTSTRRRLFFR